MLTRAFDADVRNWPAVGGHFAERVTSLNLTQSASIRGAERRLDKVKNRGNPAQRLRNRSGLRTHSVAARAVR
jgi:hypothetical protein